MRDSSVCIDSGNYAHQMYPVGTLAQVFASGTCISIGTNTILDASGQVCSMQARPGAYASMRIRASVGRSRDSSRCETYTLERSAASVTGACRYRLLHGSAVFSCSVGTSSAVSGERGCIAVAYVGEALGVVSGVWQSAVLCMRR